MQFVSADCYACSGRVSPQIIEVLLRDRNASLETLDEDSDVELGLFHQFTKTPGRRIGLMPQAAQPLHIVSIRVDSGTLEQQFALLCIDRLAGNECHLVSQVAQRMKKP